MTTLIAHWLRGLILDDGAYPAGVRFTSKYGAGAGSGICWAYWLRHRDAGLDHDPVDVLDSGEISRRPGPRSRAQAGPAQRPLDGCIVPSEGTAIPGQAVGRGAPAPAPPSEAGGNPSKPLGRACFGRCRCSCPT